jgi:hypothetical protein
LMMLVCIMDYYRIAQIYSRMIHLVLMRAKHQYHQFSECQK